MITTQKHPNSRIIKIYQKNSFIQDAQQKGAPEFMSMAKKSIGSFWENSYSKTVGTGLTFTEQKFLMPAIVDCEVTDRDFRAKVTNYFASMKTLVPYDKGRELEIGLEKDNFAPVSEINAPLNIADYLAYRHAVAHPQVAASKQDSENNMLKSFYIFDGQAQEDHELKTSQDKDKALELYLTMKKTPEKIDQLLTLLDVDPRTFKGKNGEALKLEKLKSLCETASDKVVTLSENKLFEGMYIVQTMINTGILQKIGEKIINPDNGDTIGHDMVEAVAWTKDKANSEKMVMMRARMQEGLKVIPATSKAR